MKVDKVGNSLAVELDESEIDQFGHIEVTVRRPDGKYARVFLSSKQSRTGVTFTLTAKQCEFHKEVIRTAVATFGTRPNRT